MINKFIIFCSLLFVCVTQIIAQNNNEASTLVHQILEVEKFQKEKVQNVTFDAEYIEAEEKDGKFVEKIRFDKKIYIKYDNDTAYLFEDYLAYYKESKKQSNDDLLSASKEKKEKKIKRKSKDISYSMLKPFYASNSKLYDIEYVGVASDKVESYTCHHFKVRAKEANQDLINGDYYFDAESFQLVRVEFSPSKLTKKMMFKMKKLNMIILYKEYEDNLWFPKQFEISGKGKAMFFIGVNFAGTEYYRNPLVNQNIDSKF